MPDIDNLRFTTMPLNNGTSAIPALGFGTLIPDPVATKVATIAALEAGFRQLDASERYRNETQVGEAIHEVFQAGRIKRADVFIANVLKCRPPQNREPSSQEASCCLPYLHRQIALLRPRIILCVGRIAAQNLLGVDTPLAKLRGRVHALAPLATPVVVTYHPAYLLRSPGEKRKAWVDLEFALEVAHGRRA